MINYFKQNSSRYQKIAAVVFLVAVFVPRLVSLGQILTVDEPLWQGRGQQFIKAVASGTLGDTLVGGQPGVTTAWLAGMAHHWGSLAASQAAIAIASGILIVIATYFLVTLWGFGWGMLGGAVLALDPFLLGHSRVVHTDALASLLALVASVSLLASLAPLRARGTYVRRYVIVSAVAAAWAVLTKIFTVFLIPVSLVVIAITFWRHRQSKLGWGAIGAWLCTLIIAGFVSWPALWWHSTQVASYLFERGSLHTEGTREEQATAQAWYYPRELAFRFTVPGTLLLPIGIAGLVLTKRWKTMRWSSVWLLVFGLSLAMLLSFAGDKSDRYLLYTLLVLQLLAVFGAAILVDWLQNKGYTRMAQALLLLLVAWLVLDVIRLHPYYLAHYNRLYPIEATHKLGWGEGLEKAAAWVTQVNPSAKVITYYPRVFGHFYPGQVEGISHLDDDNISYVVLYRSMYERGPDAPETDVLQQYLGKQTPLHTITINGLPYAWVFDKPAD